MARLPPSVQYQKFLEESYDKERDTRIQRYIDGKAKGNVETVSKQYEVFKKRIEAGAPKPTEGLARLKDAKPKSYHRVVADFNAVPDPPSRLKRSRTDFNALPDMRPVLPAIKDQLYDGFTKEGKGRRQYLRSRYGTKPETKFNYPILCSWEYGWKLDEVIKNEDIRNPINGRTRIVADTFYTRTGIPGLRRETTLF